MSSELPFIFGRQGGESIMLFDSLQSPNIQQVVSLFFVNDHKIETTRNLLVEKLFTMIKESQDSSLKKNLIDLKRDVFNRREIKKDSNQFSKNPNIGSLLKEYKKLIEVEFELKESLDQYVQANLVTSIEVVGSSLEKYFLKNGISASSDIFYQQILKRNFSFEVINKKSKRQIVTALKYVTRGITKTTPFSSFNEIFCIQETENRLTSAVLPRSYFLITNLFLYYLKKELLSHEPFKDSLPIRFNSNSWVVNEDTLHFFVNHENSEYFKKVANTEILQFFSSQLKEKKYTYVEFIHFVKEEIQATDEEIQSFLDQLIKQGVLYLEFPVGFDDKDWVEKLLVYIKCTKNLRSQYIGLTDLLEYINTISNDLSKIYKVDMRRTLKSDCYQRIQNTFKESNIFSEFFKKVKPYELFYEDCYTSNTQALEKNYVNNTKDQLNKLVTSLSDLSIKQEVKTKLAKKLTDHHSIRLSLIDFYQKVILADHEELQLFYTRPKKITSFLQSMMPKIKIATNNSQLDLAEFLPEKQNTNIPFGCFIHLSDEVSVVNTLTNGYGANISRYLKTIPKEQLSKLTDYIVNRSPNMMIVDVKDATIHNTNVYPPLASATLSSMMDTSFLQDRYKVMNLSDLYVTTTSDGKSIVVKNKKDQHVLPINFSMEGLKRRSNFTQFLDVFNPFDSNVLPILLENLSIIYKQGLTSSDFVCIPRIMYQSLVLQRKKWVLKTAIFKNILSEGSLSDMYLSIHFLLRKYEIPHEVFIKIAKQNLQDPLNDHYKPQYINFRSPIFIFLLQNMMKQAHSIIEITEMLPSSDDVKRQDGKVKEYILNLN